MITVRLDTKEFRRAIEKLADRLPKELQSAVNKSARSARTEFIRQVTKEVGVKRGLLKFDAGRDFTAARSTDLRALFRPSTKRVNLAETGTTKWFGKGSPLTGRTHNLSGGGSSHLISKHGFTINKKAFHRVAHGSHGTVLGAKQLKTTAPSVIMMQGHNPVRRAWGSTAARTLAETLPVAIEAAARKSGFE